MSFKKIIVAALLILPLVFVTLLFWPSKPPVRIVPNPNGYHALIKAGEQLFDPPYGKEANIDELRAYVLTNSAALAEVKSALQLESMTPWNLKDPEQFMKLHLRRIMAARRAANALVVEGEFAQLENRYEAAAISYFHSIRLGQNIVRNGLLIDASVGIACETIGAQRLEKIIPHLPAELCKQLGTDLEEIEQKREPLARIKENEHAYMRSHRGWRVKLNYLKEVLISTFNPSASPLNYSWPKYTERINATKLLRVRLAERAFEIERGRKPRNFAELIPEYLKTIPADSVANTNLVYDFTR